MICPTQLHMCVCARVCMVHVCVYACVCVHVCTCVVCVYVCVGMFVPECCGHEVRWPHKQ